MVRTRYRKLEVWQQAVELYSSIYILTQSFPISARGVVLQLRRPAAVVFMNIAEATLVNDPSEAKACLEQACKALQEVETQLNIACRYGFVKPAAVLAIADKAADLDNKLHGLLEQRRQNRGELDCVAVNQPDADNLENGDKGPEQKVYIPGSFSAGRSWKRQPALAE